MVSEVNEIPREATDGEISNRLTFIHYLSMKIHETGGRFTGLLKKL